MKKILLLLSFAMLSFRGSAQTTTIKRPQSNITSRSTHSNTKAKRGTLNGHEWVDLGLSVKWSTCNVGASQPEEYGNYYAWGDTTPNGTHEIPYFGSVDSNESMMYKKYSTNNGAKTILAPEDDAAHVNWGGAWRMPTSAEQTELRINCTWKWNPQNGVEGYKVIGPNGNSIFLPSGKYWSSTLYSSDSYHAHYLSFSSDGVGFGNNFRIEKMAVRAVCK